MRKILVLIISILCVAFLVSCNMQEQIEQMSDNIKDQIVDMMGQFIEKDTDSDTLIDDKDTSSQPDLPSDVPSDTVCDVPSDITPDEPNVPDEPDTPVIPEIPDYLLADRVKYPINKYMGITISKTTGVPFKNEDYKHKTAYGFGRLEISLNECMQSAPVTYFSISGMESNALLSFSLTPVNSERFSNIASEIYEFANYYCSSSSLTSKLRRIEIGEAPDTKISADNYALLLNLIYDDNCMENDEKIGTTFINPEIRLITGKMSTFNLEYIQDLMSEIKALRNDEFLPVGGWSFSSSTEGKNPEEVFLNNEELKALISYRNENYNTVEIHLSDFAWDTVNTESTNYVSPSDDFTSEEIQANYILRAYLILNGMDVDKASYGMINDTDTEGYGIIAKDGTKKKAFAMLEYFKKKMNGMYFSEIVANGEEGVYCYKFEDENGKTIYAIWSDNGLKSYTVRNLPENVTVSAYYTDTGAYSDEAVEVSSGILSKVISESVMFIEY